MRKLALVMLLVTVGAQAQTTSVDFGDAPGAVLPEYGKRIRSIDVRGLLLGKVELPIARCDVLTPENLSAARDALRLAADVGGSASEMGSIRVVYVDHVADLSPGHGDECGSGVLTVGLTLRPLVVQFSMQRLGDNVLPLPRPPLPALGDLAPALKHVEPKLGIGYDQAFGTILMLGAAIDPGADFAGGVDISRSLDAAFYRANLALVGRMKTGRNVWREGRWWLAARKGLEPLLADTRRADAVEAGVGSTWDLATTTHLALDGSWKQATGRPRHGGETETQHQLGARLLMDSLRASDSQPPAFLRAALWAEDVRSTAGDFRRWSLRAGYAQEIRVQPGQTVGVDVVGGAGRISGAPSPAEKFYGGNSVAQFLYDGATSAAMLHAPRGPLLRSFGERQAGLASNAGARAYWHLNLNLAWPVRRWSQPLIPDEDTGIPGPNGSTSTLKQILHRQVDRTGPNLMVEALVKQGLSREEALRQAKEAFAAIDPAVRYVIDDAPLYAVRPLLLLDIGGLSRGPADESARWTAVGIGVGVTIVSARIESGYMQTVSGPVGANSRGAAFLRIVFQNLF